MRRFGASRRQLMVSGVLGSVMVVLAGAAFACTESFRGVMAVSANGGWSSATGAGSGMNWCNAPQTGAKITGTYTPAQQIVIKVTPAVCGVSLLSRLVTGTYSVSYKAANAYTNGQTGAPASTNDCMASVANPVPLGLLTVTAAARTAQATFDLTQSATFANIPGYQGGVCIFGYVNGVSGTTLGHAVPVTFI